MTAGAGGWEKSGRASPRVPITLACSECKARNYKTTKSAAETEAIELKKFCKQCKKHTLHREVK